jgi:TetR/AcrR family transcriptional repressor of nem operon
MAKQFEKVLFRAQKDGKVRDDIPPGDLASFLLCGWEGALLRMKIKGSVRPLKRFSKLFIEDFLAARGRIHRQTESENNEDPRADSF